MFSLFKKRDTEIETLYGDLLDQSRDPKLYTDYDVPDTPHGRFQMIALHVIPHILKMDEKQSQALFDTIFQDIEYSFREIGVGDLAVPKKMKRYMKDFNGMIQAHAAANADHADIARRNIHGDDGVMNAKLKTYINGLFK
jgi:cytochrome b pre-mRNA-processing protein 3